MTSNTRSGVGYSGTPLPKKLGIKAGARVVAINPPDHLFDMLEALPDDVEVVEGGVNAVGPADVSLVFVTRLAELSEWLPRMEAHMLSGNRLWVAWPKRASKVPTDLTEDVVRQEGLALGIVDVKVCAIDEVWSGLCFMRRRS